MRRSKQKKVVVIGAGGHARPVCDVLLQNPEFQIVGLIDPDGNSGFFGLPLLGGDERLPELIASGDAEAAFVAIGNNTVRKKITLRLIELGYELVNAISPQAVVSSYAKLGRGIVVMPGAVINACADIGDGCIINTNCSVDHDDKIGMFCHIAPGVTLCGTVTVGDETFIGAGAKVIDRIHIGEHTMIGAGAAVVRDIPGYCTALGIPAKVAHYKK